MGSTMRAIIGVGVTVFLGVYIFWFVIPLGKTEYTKLLSVSNTTNSTMQQVLPIMNDWWVIFPLIIAVALGWTIWQYATGNSPFDYD